MVLAWALEIFVIEGQGRTAREGCSAQADHCGESFTVLQLRACLSRLGVDRWTSLLFGISRTSVNKLRRVSPNPFAFACPIVRQIDIFSSYKRQPRKTEQSSTHLSLKVAALQRGPSRRQVAPTQDSNTLYTGVFAVTIACGVKVILFSEVIHSSIRRWGFLSSSRKLRRHRTLQ